jgi:hypothetical protein
MARLDLAGLAPFPAAHTLGFTPCPNRKKVQSAIHSRQEKKCLHRQPATCYISIVISNPPPEGRRAGAAEDALAGRLVFGFILVG